METKIFQEIAESEREDHLMANSDNTEEMPVKKHYTPDELTDMRRNHMQNNIAMKKLTEEFKKVKAVYDAAMKPLLEENEYTLKCVRNGFVEVNQQVYLIADYTENMMGYYDKNGELIESRKLLPHERQLGIKRDNVEV